MKILLQIHQGNNTTEGIASKLGYHTTEVVRQLTYLLVREGYLQRQGRGVFSLSEKGKQILDSLRRDIDIGAEVS